MSFPCQTLGANGSDARKRMIHFGCSQKLSFPEDVRRGAAALHLDTADMHGGSRRRDPSASAMALAALDEPQHSESDASDNDAPSDSDDDGDSSENGA